jgi:predicted RNase H-like nuclease (RuvC/YqgF family)
MKPLPLLNYKGKFSTLASHKSQLTLEVESWTRLLRFLSDENVQIKIRFANVLKNFEDNRHLIQLEQFNDSFISQDELIKLLRNEVEGITRMLQREDIYKRDQAALLEKKVAGLRKNIQVAEQQFVELRRRFDQFQHDNRFGL